jgi:hypothetical protein
MQLLMRLIVGFYVLGLLLSPVGKAFEREKTGDGMAQPRYTRGGRSKPRAVSESS